MDELVILNKQIRGIICIYIFFQFIFFFILLTFLAFFMCSKLFLSSSLLLRQCSSKTIKYIPIKYNYTCIYILYCNSPPSFVLLLAPSTHPSNTPPQKNRRKKEEGRKKRKKKKKKKRRTKKTFFYCIKYQHIPM